MWKWGTKGQSGLPLLIKLNMKTRLDTQSGIKVEKGWSGRVCFGERERVVNESNILEGNLGLWGGGQREQVLTRAEFSIPGSKGVPAGEGPGTREPRLNKH